MRIKPQEKKARYEIRHNGNVIGISDSLEMIKYCITVMDEIDERNNIPLQHYEVYDNKNEYVCYKV